MANRFNNPNLVQTRKGMVNGALSPEVPTIDFRSGYRDVAGVVNASKDFLDQYTKIRYEGYQAQLQNIELQQFHEMDDASDPCELEEINKKYEQAYQTTLGDDFFARGYYKSRFYQNWQNQHQANQQKKYLQKQHDFTKIQASSTLNEMASTLSLYSDPRDMHQMFVNAEAMLDNSKHLSAEEKFSLMSSFYQSAVGKIYTNNPNNAVAWLDYAGNSYDKYGLDANEVRRKTQAYNEAKLEEFETNQEKLLKKQKILNDVELGRLAAKLVTGEAGVEDIKQASEKGLFNLNPYKEKEFYEILKKPTTETQSFNIAKQKLIEGEFSNVGDVIKYGVENNLKSTETNNLITWFNKITPNVSTEEDEKRLALKKYSEGTETIEENERLYFSGERSFDAYEAVVNAYKKDEQSSYQKKHEAFRRAYASNSLTEEQVLEGAEKGWITKKQYDEYVGVVSDNSAQKRQLDMIDELNEKGDLSTESLLRMKAEGVITDTVLKYGEALVKQNNEAKKQKEKEALEKEKEAIKQREKDEKKAQELQKEKEKKIKEKQKKEELEKQNKLTLMLYDYIGKDMLDSEQIAKLGTNSDFSKDTISKAQKYLKAREDKKSKEKSELDKTLAEKKKAEQITNAQNDIILAQEGLIDRVKASENFAKGRYYNKEDFDKVISAIKKYEERTLNVKKDLKKQQEITLYELTKKGELLKNDKLATMEDFENFISEVSISANNGQIDVIKASQLIEKLALPVFELNQQNLEAYGEENWFSPDTGYMALNNWIEDEVLGKQGNRPKEGESTGAERSAWDNEYARRASIYNQTYSLYQSALDNLAKEKGLKSTSDILKMDDESKTAIYNTAVERAKNSYLQSRYQNFSLDTKATAILSREDGLVKFGNPSTEPSSLVDERFVSVVKSSRGLFFAKTKDGKLKEITEQEYRNHGGQ